MAYHLLAHAEIEAGNPDEALRLLEHGRTLLGHDVPPRVDAMFAVAEARGLLAARASQEAVAAATRAVELLDALGPGDRGRAYVSLAEVFRRADDAERAKMLLGQALELMAEYGQKAALEAARPLADILEAEGDTAGALAVLKRATVASTAPVLTRD
jgi:tetratricopeptide (TPR) repeat protein